MRKLVSFLFLVVVAAGVWFGARWLVHRGDVKATIVFRDAHGLMRGDPVIENGTVVGRVVSINPIDDKTAITVRLGRDHRRAIVTDSLFAIEHRSLIVSNTFAVGRPIDDGAIITPREDRVATWLAKHGGVVKPYLDAARTKADEWIDRDFDSWTSKLSVDEVKKRVAKTEADLRNSNRADEAKKLKEKFDRWLQEAKK